ncbi:MAG TPA: RNase adapter RapZ [Cellvibrionaceae bacterium]|nr:RNase adapter RapZ [Cellvibrionaceae bacterium]HMW70908.1 RNase adapter RapZ [Cellvibrionaceae bacterium]
MRIVVISGRSGSGKTTALQLLEDVGFTCIDNLPVSLLPALVNQVASNKDYKFAIGIDARNIDGDLGRFQKIIANSQNLGTPCTVVFLDAANQILLKRFSETRRKHPLTSKTRSLQEAIIAEQAILQPIAEVADFTLDTSNLTLHELRSTIKKMVGGETEGTALLFESFGFKYGLPTYADFVFDVRCLPNPFWNPELRLQTGLEEGVVNFLKGQPEVAAMLEDIDSYLRKWVPSFEANNRSYLTIAIGCTGGMHRSVYLCERLAERFSADYANVQTRHRQLGDRPKF